MPVEMDWQGPFIPSLLPLQQFRYLPNRSLQFVIFVELQQRQPIPFNPFRVARRTNGRFRRIPPWFPDKEQRPFRSLLDLRSPMAPFRLRVFLRVEIPHLQR